MITDISPLKKQCLQACWLPKVDGCRCPQYRASGNSQLFRNTLGHDMRTGVISSFSAVKIYEYIGGSMKVQAMIFITILALCGSAIAQSYSGDARKIGMGGTGYSDNIAIGLIEEERQYRSIVIPLGLIQMIRDFDKFDPDDKEKFDPILALEYAANPIHYGFDRVTGGDRGRFVNDLINAEFGTLNDYRFNLVDHLYTEGLVSPTWGLTFKVKKNPDGTFHGIYAGAGPYLSASTDLNIDNELIEVLKSPTSVDVNNETYHIGNRAIGQLAMSIVGGYRARFNLPGYDNPDSDRNGIYVAMNYRHLLGFRYEDFDLAVRFDTDDVGNIVGPSTDPIPAHIQEAINNGTYQPLNVDYLNSESGRGFALDFGVGAVVDAWEFGFGINGIANRIKWDDMTLNNYHLEFLTGGDDDFIESEQLIPGKTKIELPEEYTWHIGYTWKDITAVADITRGFQGTSFNGGAEYRLSMIEFRGGMRYGLERWHPAAGIGLNLGKRFSVDFASFWSTTNAERVLKPGLAISLRFNRVDSSNDADDNTHTY